MNKKPFPYHILVFLAPAVIIYTIFMIYPLVDSLRLSLFMTNDQNQQVFAGFQNYQTLFTDPNLSPRLWGAIKNNFEFFAIHKKGRRSVYPASHTTFKIFPRFKK